MGNTAQIFAIFLLVATALTVPLVAWKWNRRRPIAERLETLSAHEAREETPSPRAARVANEALPKAIELLNPVPDAERHRLKTQLMQAGLYRPKAMKVYLTVKLILLLGPVAVGLGAGLAQAVPLSKGTLYGTIASGLGLVLPGMWLSRRKAGRQLMIRRAIPEFLDVIVICLDAGLSFQAALQRVYGELEGAFPLFTFELNIVLQEVQLGMTTGEALQRFAERTDMAEVRSLASVVIQSERYGASLTKALHVHARSLRIKRSQMAEEKGQKASVKILFPTILCIFPAIFVVLIGPAMIQIYLMMAKMK